MKRKLFAIVIAMCLCLTFLTGCDPDREVTIVDPLFEALSRLIESPPSMFNGEENPPDEKTLKTMLNEQTDITTSTEMQYDSIFEIETVVIDRRQTFATEKKDTAYCTVTLINASFEMVASCVVEFDYYDEGGWQIREYQIIAREFTLLGPPDVEYFIDKAFIVGRRNISCELESFDAIAGTAMLKYKMQLKEQPAGGASISYMYVPIYFDFQYGYWSSNSDEWIVEE